MIKNESIFEFEALSDRKLLLRLTWPVIFSLLVQGLYNFVDSIYLSNFGEAVLSALSFASIVQNIVTALLTGIVTGMNAIISKALGEANYSHAKNAVFNGCVIQGIFALFISVLSIWLVPLYFAESSGDSEVIVHGVAYLRPCMLFAFFVASQITFEGLLQSTGRTKLMLVCQLIGASVNIVLDPILIFGFAGFRGLGVSGAAYATITGQICAAICGYFLNVKYNKSITSNILYTNKVDLSMVGRVLGIGLPVSFLFIASNICNYIVNRILLLFGSTANSAFGLYTRVEQLALVPHKGFQSSMLTSIAYFYGKRDMARLRTLFICGVQFIAGWSIFCGLFFIAAPQLTLAPFQPTESMLYIGLPAVQIVGSTFLLSGFASALGAFFQAIGKSSVFLIITLCRQVFVRIPVALLLATTGLVASIWWSWPISEVLSDIVSAVFFVHFYRKIKKEIVSFSVEQPSVV